MNTKALIGIIVVIALAAVAYFAFMKPASAPSTGDTQTPTSEETGSNQKLDIVAICQGALAYMSFPSSVEAEAFVQECKEGKHPEVIEQWKQQQGITDDRAI